MAASLNFHRAARRRGTTYLCVVRARRIRLEQLLLDGLLDALNQGLLVQEADLGNTRNRPLNVLPIVAYLRRIVELLQAES